jgi:rhodanese-related sulfurtransferase
MLPTIERSELKLKLDRGDQFVLLDVRPESAFRNGHLPRAINIVSDDVRANAPLMLPDKAVEIVVYCGNAACKRSDRATERLLDMGYTNVRDYHEGKEDWVKAGLPLAETTIHP